MILTSVTHGRHQLFSVLQDYEFPMSLVESGNRLPCALIIAHHTAPAPQRNVFNQAAHEGAAA